MRDVLEVDRYRALPAAQSIKPDAMASGSLAVCMKVIHRAVKLQSIVLKRLDRQTDSQAKSSESHGPRRRASI